MPTDAGTVTAALSTIFTTDRYDTVRRTVKSLQAQTVQDRLDLLIVTSSASTLRFDEADVAGFLNVRVVEVAVGNANPQSLISWSNLLIDYGSWLDSQEVSPRGKRDRVPPASE